MTSQNPLSGFKFFENVQPETLDILGSKGEIVNFEADDVIFRLNDPANHLYGLIEGEVNLNLVYTDKVLKTEVEFEEAIQARIVEEEKSIVVDTVLPGQVFGWASVVGEARRTVTARCSEACRLIALPAAELRNMFEADNTLGYVLMTKMSNIISRRLKKRTEKLIEAWVEAFDVDEI
jgi:CRP-like cAMP-binding protein